MQNPVFSVFFSHLPDFPQVLLLCGLTRVEAEYEWIRQTLALFTIISHGRRRIEEGRGRPTVDAPKASGTPPVDKGSLFIHRITPVELKSQDQHPVVDDTHYQPPVADPVAPQSVQLSCKRTSKPSGFCRPLKMGSDVPVQELPNRSVQLFYPPRKSAVDFHPVPCHSSSQSWRASP